MADIYLVLPAPIVVTLKPGERVLSIKAQVARAFPAQRVYIQLAVVGSPVFVPTPAPGEFRLVKPGPEDSTPPPLAALQVITAQDLDKARDILAAAGVPRQDIHLTIPAAADPKRRIGQVLVAVSPITQDNFDRLAEKISDVISQYPQIARAGVVLVRDRCDAERIVESALLQDANTRAALLANAAGLSSGTLLKSDVWPGDSASGYQVLCGAQVPHTPRSESAVYTGMLANRPYGVSDNRAVLFRLTGGWRARIPHVRFEQTQTDVTGLLVSHQFVVPDGEPFVSAQGEFKAIVRPDALIAIFYTSPIPFRRTPPQLWRDLTSAIKTSGLPASAIARDERRVYARVPTYAALISLQKKTAAVREKYGPYSLGVGAVPVISDCRAIRAAVAAAAFSTAHRRALAMTSAAGVRMGRVFAISDAGESIGALCHPADAPAEELASAFDAQAGAGAALNGSGAAFSSAVVVAWQLHVLPVPRGASWPQPTRPGMYNAIYQAFIAHGTGAFGEDKTLDAATRDALEQLHGAPLQAIIDQGASPDGAQGVLVVRGS